jgi:ActR/RegA family two-component response regulator
MSQPAPSAPPAAPKFLLIDDNPDGLALLSRSLHRKFSRALILEAADITTALHAAKTENPTVIIVHRVGEHAGTEVVAMVRKANPSAPLLAVSGYDRTQQFLAAGATRFLNYDQWLLVGSVVEELMGNARYH